MPPMYMMIDPMVATRESDVTRRAKSLAIFPIMMDSFDSLNEPPFVTVRSFQCNHNSILIITSL